MTSDLPPKKRLKMERDLNEQQEQNRTQSIEEFNDLPRATSFEQFLLTPTKFHPAEFLNNYYIEVLNCFNTSPFLSSTGGYPSHRRNKTIKQASSGIPLDRRRQSQFPD